MIVKEGVVHGHTAGGLGKFFDSQTATLYFNHTIKRIEGTEEYDLNSRFLNK